MHVIIQHHFFSTVAPDTERGYDKMEKLIIKENFKEWLSNSNYVFTMKWAGPPTIIFGLPLLIFGFDIIDRFPFPVKFLYACILPLLIISSLFFIYLPFFIIFDLLPMFRLRTYVFGYDKKRFFIEKGQKMVMDVPHDAIKNIKFRVVTKEQSRSHEEKPIKMNIKYQEGGEQKDMELYFDKFIIPDRYELMEWMENYQALMKKKSCHEGMAAFPAQKENDPHPVKTWGFVDEDDKVVIEPQYLAVTRFCQGIAVVCNEKGEWNVINKKGDTFSGEDVPKDMLIGYSLPIMADMWKFKDVDFVFDIDSKEWRKPLMSTDLMTYICKDLEGYIDSPFILTFCLEQKK